VKSAPAAWDSQLASETAETAFRYVADVYPKGCGYEPLDIHTAAAYEAEQRGASRPSRRR